MPAGTVLDYSGWRPTDAQYQQMRSLGIVGLVRYPGLGPGTEWKQCTKSEYDRILAAGLQIAFTPELSASTWRGGRKAGLDVGKKAREWVHSLGFPDSRCLHFAVDTDVKPAEYGLALEYLHACGEGGSVGIQSTYGESGLIDAAVDQGITCNGWRAAATSWDTNPSRHASMVQTTQHSYPFTGAYDENIIVKPDWGQHPAPTGAPVASIDEVNLRLIQIQQEVVGDVGSCKKEKDQVTEALSVAKQALAAAKANQTTLDQILAIVQGLSIPAPAPVDVAALVRAINVDHGQRLVNG